MIIQREKELFLSFIKEFLSRDRFKDELLVDICEYMQKGNLVVRYSHVPKSFTYEDRLRFTPSEINWEMDYDNNTNLCQLYLHSLEPVKYLIQGYEITKIDNYLKLAWDIIESWLSFSKEGKKHRFTWYDHCASDRVLYLIYFLETIKSNGIEKYNEEIDKIIVLLNQHGDFLFKDENYTTQNHGTMMDRSLYLLSRYLEHPNVENWKIKAINRLKVALNRDFSINMVNLENSSSYHLFNFDLFVVIEKSLLNLFEDSLGDDFDNVINKGIEYMIHLSKPDLFFPVMGDGSKFSISSIKNHPSYKYIKNHEELNFVLTSGQNGTMPSDLVKTYFDEGYSFMRNSWDYKNYKDDITYASFIAGYKLKNHKHGDDLSFTLYSKGRDVFVDCGTYTYQAGEFRKHFMSAMSHNTILVDGNSYPFIQGDPNNTAILDQGQTNNYFYVIGKNDLYPGVNITRSFYFLNSGKIIIVDDVISKKTHTYSQLFNFSHKLIGEMKISNNKFSLIEKDITVNINQVIYTDLYIHRGDVNEAKFGIISEGFNSINETLTLEYQIEGNSGRFITLISVDSNDETEEFNAVVNDNTLLVQEKGNVFEIALRNKSRSIMGIFLEEEKINLNSYKFTIVGTDSNSEYAWYVIKEGERIEVLWYKDYTTLEYTFITSGEYEIHYYIRNKNNHEEKVRFIHKITIR